MSQAYGSDYKGILEYLTKFFSTFSKSCIFCLAIIIHNYGTSNRFSVYHVRLVDCGYYYDMQ